MSRRPFAFSRQAVALILTISTYFPRKAGAFSNAIIRSRQVRDRLTFSKSSTPQELKEYLVRSSFDGVSVKEASMWVYATGSKPLETKARPLVKSKRDSLVVSIHVPKCGGTSFRVVLNAIYEKGLFLEYSASREEQISNAKSIDHETECIHGHLLYDGYGQVMRYAKLITWLRHPVDRTVSLYNHIMSKPTAGHELHDWVISNQPPLLEFAEFKLSRNFALGGLINFIPEDFEFIGFLESAKSSMIKCASALGWSTIPEFPHVNKGSAIQTHSLTERERKFIEDLNSEEMKWYLRAKKVFG